MPKTVVSELLRGCTSGLYSQLDWKCKAFAAENLNKKIAYCPNLYFSASCGGRNKQELEGLRNETTLLLRERFQLEQCIRWAAVMQDLLQGSLAS